MISRSAALRLRIPLLTKGFRNLSRFSSSWSSSATATATATGPTSDDRRESLVYEASRKFGRPATIPWSHQLFNSVTFIGTVEYPPKQCHGNEGKLGAHTILLVKPSPNSSYHFRLMLSMWDILAEIALAHLKPNDYIYVSGQLGSYTKSTLEGTERTYYKVTVKELNYVEVPNENFLVAAKSGSESGESADEKNRNRLHLWQILFANPDEWDDLREANKGTKRPDFKHKSTGEALWLSSFDPPWVKNQVELLASRLSGRSTDFGSVTSDMLSNQ